MPNLATDSAHFYHTENNQHSSQEAEKLPLFYLSRDCYHGKINGVLTQTTKEADAGTGLLNGPVRAHFFLFAGELEV